MYVLHTTKQLRKKVCCCFQNKPPRGSGLQENCLHVFKMHTGHQSRHFHPAVLVCLSSPRLAPGLCARHLRRAATLAVQHHTPGGKGTIQQFIHKDVLDNNFLITRIRRAPGWLNSVKPLSLDLGSSSDVGIVRSSPESPSGSAFSGESA